MEGLGTRWVVSTVDRGTSDTHKTNRLTNREERWTPSRVSRPGYGPSENTERVYGGLGSHSLELLVSLNNV